MRKRSRPARKATPAGGQSWLWAADGLGLFLVVSLAAAAAGAPALAHIACWLMMTLPLAGLLAVAAAERRRRPAPVVPQVRRVRILIITPRPEEIRGKPE